MTITEADILRSVKQKLTEFEAARDQPARYVPETDESFSSVVLPARIKESVDCLS